MVNKDIILERTKLYLDQNIVPQNIISNLAHEITDTTILNDISGCVFAQYDQYYVDNSVYTNITKQKILTCIPTCFPDEKPAIGGSENPQKAIEEVTKTKTNMISKLSKTSTFAIDWLNWTLKQGAENLEKVTTSFLAYISLRITAMTNITNSSNKQKEAGNAVLQASDEMEALVFPTTTDPSQVSWADPDIYPSGMGEENLIGLSTDNSNQAAAYLAVYNKQNKILINIWDGSKLVRSITDLIEIDTDGPEYDHWSPQLTPSKTEGAWITFYLNGKIYVQYIGIDGTLGSLNLIDNSGSSPTVVADNDGNLHFTYNDTQSMYISAAVTDGSPPVVTSVGGKSILDMNNIGIQPAIACDNLNHPHVVYVNGKNFNIYDNIGSGWVTNILNITDPLYYPTAGNLNNPTINIDTVSNIAWYGAFTVGESGDYTAVGAIHLSRTNINSITDFSTLEHLRSTVVDAPNWAVGNAAIDSEGSHFWWNTGGVYERVNYVFGGNIRVTDRSTALFQFPLGERPSGAFRIAKGENNIWHVAYNGNSGLPSVRYSGYMNTSMITGFDHSHSIYTMSVAVTNLRNATMALAAATKALQVATDLHAIAQIEEYMGEVSQASTAMNFQIEEYDKFVKWTEDRIVQVNTATKYTKESTEAILGITITKLEEEISILKQQAQQLTEAAAAAVITAQARKNTLVNINGSKD